MEYTKGEISKLAMKGECGCILNINCPFHKAAPDMYKALKGILLVATPLNNSEMEFEKSYPGTYRVLGNRLDDAVKALAKAEGEE